MYYNNIKQKKRQYIYIIYVPTVLHYGFILGIISMAIDYIPQRCVSDPDLGNHISSHPAAELWLWCSFRASLYRVQPICVMYIYKSGYR